MSAPTLPQILDKLSEALPVACLYEELRAAGVPIDSHESDLYFPATERALTILARHDIHRHNARPFVCITDGGRAWMEVPFAYAPWWEAQCERRPA